MDTMRLRKKVYILEDDLDLATLIDRVLKSIDPDIVLDWSTSAEQAIQAVEQAKKEALQKPFDLIIIDMFLDGQKTGLDFWNQCKIQYPSIPVILTSSAPFVPSETILPQNVFFLQKPFTVDACKKLMASILSNSARPHGAFISQV